VSGTPYDPHAVIEVGGKIFDSWRETQLFRSLSADLTTDEASQAEWEMFDPDGKLLDGWTTNDGLALLPCRVWLGFGSDLGKPLFEGLLARDKRVMEATTLTFLDYSLKMRQVQRTEYHKGRDSVGVIASLAKRDGLMFEGPTPAIKLDAHKSLKQEAKTDWDFAHDRADEVGLALYTRGNTLYAKEAAKTGAPILEIIRGKTESLLDNFSFTFRLPENREGRPSQVEVRTRGKGGRAIRGKSDSNARGHSRIHIRRDLSIKTKRMADRRAQAKKDLEREHSHEAVVELLGYFPGRPPDARDTVLCKNFWQLHSGKYLVDHAHYEFSPGEMRAELNLYRDIKTN
jgi:phage protein D